MANDPVKLLWTERAIRHLGAFYAYIAEDSPQASDTMLDRLLEAVENLARFPQLGRTGRVEDTRELILPNVRLIVTYRIHQDQIQILAVLHAARQWPESF
jgi:addiction module RelE/StbE family toxin